MTSFDWPYATPGIPDSAFLRGNVPMTKEEVRSVTLCKLRLRPGDTVVDVGAGTGSIAIEAARLCPQGKVYAIERQAEALSLIEQNSRRFGVKLQILPGEATARLPELTGFDRVVVGGSGGTLREILQLCDQRLLAQGRVVVNAITIETVFRAVETLKTLQYDQLDVVSLSVARGRLLGNSTLMEALNQVYIISASKPI